MAESDMADGKLTARERLDVLFDISGWTLIRPATALLLARGTVAGRPVLVAARDVTTAGGALTVPDLQALTGLALEDTAAPLVLLLGGAALVQDADAAAVAAMAALHAALAQAGRPKLALVFDRCVGPDALLAALADMVIIASDSGFVAASGPELRREVTGEVLTGTEIGGAALHAAQGALVEAAPHDLAVLLRARLLLDGLPDLGEGEACFTAPPAPLLERLIPSAPGAIYDMRDLLAMIADAGHFLNIAADAAPTLLSGFLRLGGRTVAVLANQPQERAGVLDAPALAKAAGFAAWAARLGAPMLTVIDSPGLMPGQEAAGLLPAAACLLRALQSLAAPRVALITRNARGPAASLMGLAGSRVLRWPSAHIALAGGTTGTGAAPETLFGPVIAPGETRAALLAAFARKPL